MKQVNRAIAHRLDLVQARSSICPVVSKVVVSVQGGSFPRTSRGEVLPSY